MISKSKLATGLAGVATMFLLAGTSLSAVSASADPGDPDAQGACQVTGGVTVAGAGITNTAGATSGTFNSTTLNCSGAPGSDDAGTWAVNASFSSASETCAADAAGAGSFTGGTGPGGDDAKVTGGSFTFTRTGLNVFVQGNLNTSNSAGSTHESHPFTAHLIFVPGNGVCSNPTLSAGTTSAQIATGSTAVITGES